MYARKETTEQAIRRTKENLYALVFDDEMALPRTIRESRSSWIEIEQRCLEMLESVRDNHASLPHENRS